MAICDLMTGPSEEGHGLSDCPRAFPEVVNHCGHYSKQGVMHEKVEQYVLRDGKTALVF